MKKHVVITGIGVATPIGCEKKKFWENLCSGKSSISDLHLKGLEECYSQKYGLLDPEEVQQLEAKLLADAEQNLSKCSKLALVTAIQAVQDANISFDTLEEQLRTGVFFGTTQSDQYAFTEELEDLQRNRFTAPVHVAKHFHLHGSVFFNANLCASGNHALGYAWDAIQSGKLDTVLAGGVDVFSTITYVGFNRLKALSVDSVKPFDRNRNGTILSEGAAVFVLEELEHAKKRNAPIYGEIIGYGMSNDAYNIVAPDPTGEGVIQAMERAIAHSGISARYWHRRQRFRRSCCNSHCFPGAYQGRIGNCYKRRARSSTGRCFCCCNGSVCTRFTGAPHSANHQRIRPGRIGLPTRHTKSNPCNREHRHEQCLCISRQQLLCGSEKVVSRPCIMFIFTAAVTHYLQMQISTGILKNWESGPCFRRMISSLMPQIKNTAKMKKSPVIYCILPPKHWI